jgi:uncharacterized membrane protein
MTDKSLLVLHWVLLVLGFLLVLAALWVWSWTVLVAGLVAVAGSALAAGYRRSRSLR